MAISLKAWVSEIIPAYVSFAYLMLTQRQLAAGLGISLDGYNYVLKPLVETGLVNVDTARNSRRETDYLYLFILKGVAQQSAFAAEFFGRELEQ